jgi:hypothetical protein
LKPPSLGARKIFFENRMLHFILLRVPIEKSISQTLILFFGLMIAISIYVNPTNVKLFASKFTVKKLGGPVGS